MRRCSLRAGGASSDEGIGTVRGQMWRRRARLARGFRAEAEGSAHSHASDAVVELHARVGLADPADEVVQQEGRLAILAARVPEPRRARVRVPDPPHAATPMRGQHETTAVRGIDQRLSYRTSTGRRRHPAPGSGRRAEWDGLAGSARDRRRVWPRARPTAYAVQGQKPNPRSKDLP